MISIFWRLSTIIQWPFVGQKDFIFQEFQALLSTLFMKRARSLRVRKIDCCLYRQYGWIGSASAQKHFLIKAQAWKNLFYCLATERKAHLPDKAIAICQSRQKRCNNYQAHLSIKNLWVEKMHEILDNLKWSDEIYRRRPLDGSSQYRVPQVCLSSCSFVFLVGDL